MICVITVSTRDVIARSFMSFIVWLCLKLSCSKNGLFALEIFKASISYFVLSLAFLTTLSSSFIKQ